MGSSDESTLLCLLPTQGFPGGVSWERGSSPLDEEEKSIMDAGWWREEGAEEECW